MYSKKELKNITRNVGDNVVIHDVATRKVFFFEREVEGFRLKKTWSKRANPIVVRATDRLYRAESTETGHCFVPVRAGEGTFAISPISPVSQ